MKNILSFFKYIDRYKLVPVCFFAFSPFMSIYGDKLLAKYIGTAVEFTSLEVLASVMIIVLWSLMIIFGIIHIYQNNVLTGAKYIICAYFAPLVSAYSLDFCMSL